jgi:3-deoxy-D-manno-octulosonic-acid transferase
MFLVYNIFSFIALIFYLPRLLLKKGPENRSAYIGERLGMSDYESVDIWVHAVSVGEVVAALPFLKALKKNLPDLKVLLSTTTYTGQKVASDKFTGADRLMYMPWDTGVCVKRAVRALRPGIFIAVETELWPALFYELKKAGTEIVVLNGRLSYKSFRGYMRIRPFIKRVLSLVRYFYMQSKSDVDRIVMIGAEPEKVVLMGNFKFDAEFKTTGDDAGWLRMFKGRLMVAGSTHRGEEEMVIDAYEKIRELINDLNLVLAPRHPERFTEVEEILRQKNLKFCRRSEIKDGISTDLFKRDLPCIILLDTIGELSQVYAKADVAFVGGSLQPFGGHNILEPAYWGKPVVFGPFMDNFPISSDFLRKDAAVEVKGTDDMASSVMDILNNREKARSMGEKARTIVRENKGAVEKALKLVEDLLGTA